MTTRSRAACRIEQHGKKLPGEVAAVHVGVKRIAIATVGPPETGLAQRVKTFRGLTPANVGAASPS
jgi:hypothetical protein